VLVLGSLQNFHTSLLGPRLIFSWYKTSTDYIPGVETDIKLILPPILPPVPTKLTGIASGQANLIGSLLLLLKPHAHLYTRPTLVKPYFVEEGKLLIYGLKRMNRTT
jgi:hypothetical protein